MKKAKKLVLYRETLRALEAPALGVAGAAKPTTSPLPNTQVTSCDYTYSCIETCGACTSLLL